MQINDRGRQLKSQEMQKRRQQKQFELDHTETEREKFKRKDVQGRLYAESRPKKEWI